MGIFIFSCGIGLLFGGLRPRSQAELCRFPQQNASTPAAKRMYQPSYNSKLKQAKRLAAKKRMQTYLNTQEK